MDIEKYANIAHEVWMGWAKNLINNHLAENGEIIIPKERVDRWKELLIDYNNLSEEEKDKDRVEALKYINEFLKEIV